MTNVTGTGINVRLFGFPLSPYARTSVSIAGRVLRLVQVNFFVRFLMAAALLRAFSTYGLGQSVSSESPADALAAQRGEALFSGRRPLRNGGPPCASCHAVAGLPFPNGGTLAPDLTREYAKLGPQGIDVALETLFFPAMTPIYDTHSLTREERSDLGMFLEQASTKPPPHGITPVIVLIPICGGIVLLGITALVWRNRLRGVRKQLVAAARARGDAYS
jgi:mono/diheme cytochrome c family protein